MLRSLWILAALTSCKQDKPPAVVEKGSQVAVPIDAAPDAAPDAAITRPTHDQALAAARRWIDAAAGKDPQKLVEVSALPFALTDEYNQPSCGDELEDAAAITKAAACLRSAKLRATLTNKESVQLKPDFEVPDPAATITAYASQWNALVPEAERATHTFVELFSNHPKYPADVLYGLFSVKLVDGAPLVDGAVLVFASEGD